MQRKLLSCAVAVALLMSGCASSSNPKPEDVNATAPVVEDSNATASKPFCDSVVGCVAGAVLAPLYIIGAVVHHGTKTVLIGAVDVALMPLRAVEAVGDKVSRKESQSTVDSNHTEATQPLALVEEQ